MPRIKRNQGVRSGRGQKNLTTVTPAAVAATPPTAVEKHGLRLRTVSTCTMVLALSCVFAFPSMRDQLSAKGAPAQKISRTAQHIKGPARIPWAASSKT
jgi:hypothetical protein